MSHTEVQAAQTKSEGQAVKGTQKNDPKQKEEELILAKLADTSMFRPTLEDMLTSDMIGDIGGPEESATLGDLSRNAWEASRKSDRSEKSSGTEEGEDKGKDTENEDMK